MSHHPNRNDYLLFGLLGLWWLSEIDEEERAEQAEKERLEREEEERLEKEEEESEERRRRSIGDGDSYGGY